MDHARISKGVPRPLPGFADFFCLVTKETGERKRRRSVAARLFTLRFSHRFQRIAKAQLIWYSASPNGLGVFSLIHPFLKQ